MFVSKDEICMCTNGISLAEITIHTKDLVYTHLKWGIMSLDYPPLVNLLFFEYLKAKYVF